MTSTASSYTLPQEYAVFSNPDFNANDYANSILSGEPYSVETEQAPGKTAAATRLSQDGPAKEDISGAITKLSTGIDDISKQIKQVVVNHHEDLLSQAANTSNLSGSITSLKGGLNDLNSSLDKLKSRIRVPYQSLEQNVSCLQRFQQAAEILRRTSRFVILARRLQVQMSEIENHVPVPHIASKKINGKPVAENTSTDDEKDRLLAKAALSIAELETLVGPASSHVQPTEESEDAPETIGSTIPLDSIDAVAAHVPFLKDARQRVTTEMEEMVATGLSSLNQTLLASSLQTAYNLRVLPELTQKLLMELSQTSETRIADAFDLSKISKDALAKETPPASAPHASPAYRSRVRTEPTSVTAPQFTAALWSRLESMIEDISECCVYALEKVLKIKKDPATQVLFMDEAMKVLENKPSATFWTSLGRALEKNTRESAKSSTFLQQTLSAGYPRLLRLFHEFFSKIAVQSDTVYSATQQSPETVFVLRSLSNFETLYLSRSTNKLNEVVGQAVAGGSRAPPGSTEGINIARTLINELDSARFDPLLVRSVAKNAVSSLDMFLTRIDALVNRDRSVTNFTASTASPQLVSNAQLATCLYQCWTRLDKLRGDHTETIITLLRPAVDRMKTAYENVIEPVKTAIRRELGAIIAKLHRVDLSKAPDPASSMGGSSLYMKEMTEKLTFIKSEVLGRFGIDEGALVWTREIAIFVLKTFVLHVSIARPLGESGKLTLTSDMTELEFALSAFTAQGQSKRGGNLESLGDDYRALRALRPLLFLDNSMLADPNRTAGLPPLIVLHHILVRSPLPLPHELHGWQETEYVRWVEEHTEQEAWSLIEGGLSHWEKTCESEGTANVAEEYIDLARKVLDQ